MHTNLLSGQQLKGSAVRKGTEPAITRVMRGFGLGFLCQPVIQSESNVNDFDA